MVIGIRQNGRALAPAKQAPLMEWVETHRDFSGVVHHELKLVAIISIFQAW